MCQFRISASLSCMSRRCASPLHMYMYMLWCVVSIDALYVLSTVRRHMLGGRMPAVTYCREKVRYGTRAWRHHHDRRWRFVILGFSPRGRSPFSRQPSSIVCAMVLSTVGTVDSEQSQSTAAVLIIPTSELSTLAKKVPTAKQTGDAVTDNRLFQEEHMFRRLVHLMQKDATLIEPLHGALLRLMAARQSAPTEQKWSSVSSMNRMEEKWVADWIVKQSLLTHDDIAKMRSADPESIRHLQQFALQIPGGTRVHEHMIYKEVAEGVFNSRALALKHRLKDIGRDFLTPEGHLRWDKGAYTFVFNEACATLVKHISGVTASLPPYVTITTSFCIDSNHDDHAATAKLGPAAYRLCDFFPAGVGPHSYPVWTKKSSLVTDLSKGEYSKMTERLRAAGRATGSVVTGVEMATSARKVTAAKRAREALETKRENLAKQRRVTLM